MEGEFGRICSKIVENFKKMANFIIDIHISNWAKMKYEEIFFYFF